MGAVPVYRSGGRVARSAVKPPGATLIAIHSLQMFGILTRLDKYINRNRFSTRRASEAEVLALIAKLKPVDCGIELIRIGGDRDGGYLVPDDLDGIEYCFSPGVSTIADFENQLADRGIHSFLADYSVEAPPIARSEFTFDKKFLGATDRESYFTLLTWKNKYLSGYSGDLLLQMDIEGAEYEVILNTPDDLLGQFRIAVIEFHFLDRLFEPLAFKILSACFNKLLAQYHVVHLHPNNLYRPLMKGGVEVPLIMEATFLNKQRAAPLGPRVSFPHPLDADNLSSYPPLPLPACWYAPSAGAVRPGPTT